MIILGRVSLFFICYNNDGDCMFSILLGILPGIVFSILFFFLDKNRKDINLVMLIATFIFGCLSSYICYRLEWHFGSYFKKVAVSNIFEVFIYALFGVAIFEEGSKLFFSILFSGFNGVKKLSNIITYSIFATCGFLSFENAVFYSMKYGLITSFNRLFTSSPGHVCYGLIMGLFLYKVNRIDLKSGLNLLLALFVPSILHAIYNTFLYKGIEYMYIISYVFLYILIFVCFYIVFKVYKEK